MGLDMYLTKKIYIGAQFDFRNVTGTVEISIEGKPVPINFKKIQVIVEAVAVWRKANAIHQWFVHNLQNNDDDCGEYYFSVDEMKTLLNICKRIEVNPEFAPCLLPTTSGFFFGSTDYDDWYFHDIHFTIGVLEEALKDADKNSYYYSSSW